MRYATKIRPVDLARPRKALALATRELARKAGRVAKENIQAQVPDGSGPVGKWTGEMATGKLKAAIVAQEPYQQRKGDWVVRVGVQHTRRAAIYARIHEHGGIIRPVRAKVLRFRIGNQVVFAKQVRIRRKGWFLAGWKSAKSALLQWQFREVRIR